jgi:LuxR family transcriptional regulator, maltose regulon positive regulatory protein
MARKEHKTTPKVIWRTLYTMTGALPVESPLWFDWLASNASFYLESPAGTFTARRELRNGCSFWYAFRRQRNRLYKAYLGKSADLTHARLLAVAQHLAEKAGAGARA